MKRNISLYIDGVQADLTGDSLILFNYTRDEQSNPTIVKNSYSQNISLPGTPTNNGIFDRICNLDRITTSGAFNPLAKTPFVIYNDGNEILESGYVKLNKVTRNESGIATYEVSLYGGLGGFFYNLMYKADGTKKSLADLYFPDYTDTSLTHRLPSSITLEINKTEVSNAWKTLAGQYSSLLYQFINFAPCYNGFPSCKFAADKAVYKQGAGQAYYPNLYTSKDGYSAKSGMNGTILLEMSNQHTEWEVQDLRSYLQRPILRVRELLEAITLSENCGEYTFVIDQQISDQANDWYWDSWMTLKMFDRDTLDVDGFTLADLLSGTSTPADYLIGYAKVFGLVFRYNQETKTITLMKRNEYYTGDTIDLSERVQRDKNIVPYVMTSKNYIWQPSEVYGQFGEEYSTKYGRKYGAQYVNTGYEFDAEAVDVLKDVVYKGAPDALEANLNYHIYGGNSDDQGSYVNNLFKFALTEDVTWKLYKTESGKEVEQSFTPSGWWLAPFGYAGDSSSYLDFMPKVQLHSTDNQAQTGSNVLLFFNGMVNTPSGVLYDVTFHLSDDTSAMLSLNGGEPCWDVSVQGNNILNVSSLPSFRRFLFNNGTMVRSMEMGDPFEIPTNESLVLNKGIYHNFWESLAADKYDVDARVVTCKVDFSGIQVNADLLRKFYTFGGCLWVLNKITNYSLTTYDPVECEFIKVTDPSAYTSGQIEF